MWWNRGKNATPVPKEVTIKARLRKGETLQISFNDSREPRQLHIEGWGEVRLRIKSLQDVAAELVHADSVSH